MRNTLCNRRKWKGIGAWTNPFYSSLTLILIDGRYYQVYTYANMHVHVDMEQISLSSIGGRKTGMHISLVSEDEFPFFFVTCILSAILIRLLLIILNTFWRVIWGLTRVSCTDRNFTGPYEFLPMKAEEISNSISLICLPPIINSLSYACHFSATTLIFFLLNMNKYLWFILGKAWCFRKNA